MSYPVITWIQIVIFSVCTPYCLAVIVIFLTKIKEPSIRERFPYLVLVTGTACLIIVMIDTLPCIVFASIDATNLTKMWTLCVIEKIKSNLLFLLIIVPIILRSYKFLKIKKLVENFSRKKNTGNALQYYSLFYIFIISIIMIVLLVLVVETVLQTIDLKLKVFSFSQLYATCRFINGQYKIFQSTYLTALFIGYMISFVCESAALVYFVFSLRGVKAKYSINLELKNITATWIFQQIFALVITALPYSTENDSYLKIIESLTCVTIVTLTILIPLLQMKKYEVQKHSKGCVELSRQFPQALFFWIPNHYYDKFLRRCYPDLVPYRPLLADILRFDYQISDYLEKYSIIDLEQGICDTDTEERTSQRRLLSHPTAKETKFYELYRLVMYMQARYFSEESQWLCRFEGGDQIRENLKSRFNEIRVNLNEYLFEFARTYLEDKLKPSYDDFLLSGQSREMQGILKSGEMFEWILSQKPRF